MSGITRKMKRALRSSVSRPVLVGERASHTKRRDETRPDVLIMPDGTFLRCFPAGALPKDFPNKAGIGFTPDEQRRILYAFAGFIVRQLHCGNADPTVNDLDALPAELRRIYRENLHSVETLMDEA